MRLIGTMKIINTFIHTDKDINGIDCQMEFLVPNVVDKTNSFIGLTTGKSYEKGLVVGTHKTWNEFELFNLVKKVKKVGFFGNSARIRHLKDYLSQLNTFLQTYPDYVVEISKDFTILPIEPRKEFLKRVNKLNKLSKEKRDAYAELCRLCLNDLDYLEALKLISKLNDYDNHYEYCSTLNFVIEKLRNKGILLFIAMDWKQEIYDLETYIKSILKRSYSIAYEILSINPFDITKSISTMGVFEFYNEKLKTYNLEITLINTDGDEYVFIIHQIKDKRVVENNIELIGY